MIRAIDTAPAIAEKITVKLRTLSAAFLPGMNSSMRSRRAFIVFRIRFLTAGAARAISGASVAIGQPVSERSQ